MSLVDTVLNISSAMQAMLDFLAEDEVLGNDFEEFLKNTPTKPIANVH